MSKKTHFNDGRGPICGASSKLSQLQALDHADELYKVDRDALRSVSCLRCVKKLREWGFALQSFAILTGEVLEQNQK
ncbi:MAG TPA: hypothetical protein VHO25_10145 [Polyangiaceae bacterium]|nr:hypothetical protein [Polyangiaceae bacterium]